MNGFSDSLLCSNCGHPITHSSDLVNVPSKKSIHSRNGTAFGRNSLLIQTFKNAHGSIFDLISTWVADVFKLDEGSTSDTWYPGYLWHIIFCPKCGYHVGCSSAELDRWSCTCPYNFDDGVVAVLPEVSLANPDAFDEGPNLDYSFDTGNTYVESNADGDFF
ncbi:hypothetical protein HELRODRAFT_159141 [Helobdella robusta]|uniref:CULT domain-containing protein n=1 Tax=Helobdella robusta TaxID=6412 RepID=T1ENN3_HELRO|nr:hypothetical protein HELRODRAFT_159141 [Helobdella robusta]ESO12580.1 hypothetical protein HELRODRAFT_159141 [Helobdella robusta]